MEETTANLKNVIGSTAPRLIFTTHARERMRDRGLEPDLLEKALASPGKIIDQSVERGQIIVTYRIDSKEVLVVVLKKVSDDTFKVLTAFCNDDARMICKINIDRARNLIKYDPGAAIILGVSAFEAFCSDHFSALGDFEKYLVDSRRISFQQLDAAKEIFRIRMGVNLSGDAESWEMLHNVFKARHALVHCGGALKDGTLVHIDEKVAERGLEAIETILHPFLEGYPPST